ncbi:ERV/ALR sulfhydryl oxidase domain-containing protein [Entophlyctis helioformis]|nr:ERV/ALR sulfhydryl oxidase domain-containing protein [Entophlyctis helioformis]
MPATGQHADAPAEDCGVCGDFRTLRRKKTAFPSPPPPPPPPSGSDTSSSASASASASTATAAAAAAAATTLNSSDPSATSYRPYPCPPDSSELGIATWTFLHTMAAYYPATPTKDDRESMRSFLSALGRFYPCGYCASHLREYTRTHPPALNSNKALSKWFCQAHNEVNVRQGKPVFDCETVLERWRTGRPECYSDVGDH